MFFSHEIHVFYHENHVFYHENLQKMRNMFHLHQQRHEVIGVHRSVHNGPR